MTILKNFPENILEKEFRRKIFSRKKNKEQQKKLIILLSIPCVDCCLDETGKSDSKMLI